MDALLSKLNQQRRNGKRMIAKDYILRKREDFLHICFNSPGCRYREIGSCTMCDYGQGTKLTESRLKLILPEIKKAADGMQSILIGTLGSVLDSAEISLVCLELICDMLNELPIRTIIFETHYTMVNDSICCWLTEHLPKKDIVIEVGLESVDAFVQEKCLNKAIDLHILESKIQILHHHGMSITVNAFLGAPFLSAAEQLEDTVKTVQWAFRHMVDSVVIFPANIRTNTLLDLLYQNHLYAPVRHWAVFELLRRLPADDLGRIYLAWYGDWSDLDENNTKLNFPPCSCEKCAKNWMGFYHQFLRKPDHTSRKLVLEEYGRILPSGCECYKEFIKSLEEVSAESREERAGRIRNWLEDFMYR